VASGVSALLVGAEAGSPLELLNYLSDSIAAAGETATALFKEGVGTMGLPVEGEGCSHRIVLHCIASHCIASHCIVTNCNASRRIASHRISLHCIKLHRIASHCIKSYCIVSHCITRSIANAVVFAVILRVSMHYAFL
jgi:hypothetical protein